MVIEPEKYLEYLDKEMNIMGILSAFAVALGALVPDHIFSADSKTYFAKILCAGQLHVMIGAMSAIVAALYFYKERSLLAWYFGQITLSAALQKNEEVKKHIEESDGWDTWACYRLGFIALSVSFVSYGYAVLETNFPVAQSLPYSAIFWVALAIAILTGAIIWFVLNAFPSEDDPFQAWWISLKRRLSKSGDIRGD